MSKPNSFNQPPMVNGSKQGLQQIVGLEWNGPEGKRVATRRVARSVGFAVGLAWLCRQISRKAPTYTRACNA